MKAQGKAYAGDETLVKTDKIKLARKTHYLPQVTE
jgi:hypothetical protein